MPCLPNHWPTRLRPQIILPEVGALVLGLSAIALSTQPISLWLAGVILILLHTILFYRLGRISERARSEQSPDFIRGLKQGLMGRPDLGSDSGRR
jgi:membrane protein implicated in regulation of membrane protease activity